MPMRAMDRLGGRGTRSPLNQRIFGGGRATWTVLAGGGRALHSTSDYSLVGVTAEYLLCAMDRLGWQGTRLPLNQHAFCWWG